ncbi:MAG: hypothetical protein QNJ64_16195 [Crocosphaera sp.]|nr:hypothetical protein [Crocosphaera sp.]
MSQENTSPISSNMSNDSDPLNNQLSQEKLIIALETTITKLDLIVNHLSEKQIEVLPSQEALETLINSTETIANSLESQSEVSTSITTETPVLEETEEWEPSLEISEDTPAIEKEEKTERIEKQEDLETVKSGLDSGPRWGIIGGVSILVIGVLSASFFFFKPSLPDFEIPQITLESPPSEIVETPLELEVPELPQPIKNIPAPQPKLTPEQSLIAAIQKEVTALTHEYSDDLIGTIEANFVRSRLIVTIGKQWDSLSEQEQDNLATNIFERAKSLDFSKLELIDATGETIARSPVVGNDVIILKRHSDTRSYSLRFGSVA